MTRQKKMAGNCYSSSGLANKTLNDFTKPAVTSWDDLFFYSPKQR